MGPYRRRARVFPSAAEVPIEHVRSRLRTFLPELRRRRIAVVHGPVSPEDHLNGQRFDRSEWSLTKILSTMAGLRLTAGHLDPTSDGFAAAVQAFDLVFLNVHGPYGEDGRIQGLLDYLEIPYTTSGVSAGCVGADKELTKAVCGLLSIRVPAHIPIDPAAPTGRPPPFGFPAMLKAAHGGTSVGIALVEDGEVPAALVELAGHGYDRFFLEQYLPGRAVTVGLLDLPDGTVVLPVLEAVTDRPFYDYGTKFILGEGTAVRFQLSDDLPSTATAEMNAAASELYAYLGCRGAARIDFVVAAADGLPYLLEINTIPGFHPRGNLALAARPAGLDHEDLVLALLVEAYVRLNRAPWRQRHTRPAVP